MEVMLVHNYDQVNYEVVDVNSNDVVLNKGQVEALIHQLSSKCRGCKVDCCEMGSISDDGELLDKNGQVISVEYCPAAGTPVTV